MLNVLKSLFDVKKLLVFTVFVAAIYLYGCGSNTTNPLATDVTFQMTSGPGTNGTAFGFKPSVDIHLTRLVVGLPAQSFFDTLTDAGTYTYSKDTTYTISEYTGVATGQQWTFQFTGTNVSANTPFDQTTNFTIP